MRTDNDSVYTGGDLKDICESQGIKQETTPAYRHTAAAVAERFWRTLLGITRALLISSPLAKSHWPLAARHGNYLYLRHPHSTLEFTTPFEAVEHKKDVGVMVHQSLKPSMQCSKAAAMACRSNGILGQLSRAVSYRDRATLLKLYKSAVRLHMRYFVLFKSPKLTALCRPKTCADALRQSLPTPCARLDPVFPTPLSFSRLRPVQHFPHLPSDLGGPRVPSFVGRATV